MDKLLETHKLLETQTPGDTTKLTQKETENLNIPITSKEIEQVIQNLPINKNSGFTGECDQSSKNN